MSRSKQIFVCLEWDGKQIKSRVSNWYTIWQHVQAAIDNMFHRIFRYVYVLIEFGSNLSTRAA